MHWWLGVPHFCKGDLEKHNLFIVEEHNQLTFECWTHNMFDDDGQGEDGTILNVVVLIC